MPASTLKELFLLMRQKQASDLHLTSGVPPVLRIDGHLIQTPFEPLTPDACQRLVYSLMSEQQRSRFEQTNEIDMAFAIEGLGRLRMNVYRQRGRVGAAIRAVPSDFKSFEELGLPPVSFKLMELSNGIILITGESGSGKSTTLASMINYLNQNESMHIVTIEDPIEFVHEHRKSLVNQREVGSDTESFSQALKYILRQDPDVILIGEMRDLETISTALNVAETGHLVLATLHTQDSVQTFNRIIDVFPSGQQEQIRIQLSFVLQAVFSQQLVPMASGAGRALAAEVLMATPAVRHLIREKKLEQIHTMIQTGSQYGMQTMNYALAKLVMDGAISLQDGLTHCTDAQDFRQLVQQNSRQTGRQVPI
ncbi:MAG: type IV pili twitching motility protein PilT [Elusimicrobia bacterium RIFCSPLOWO2_12_FULL_59_9]|nr:MAG: type IV pili twitching motility protein PilT [Elusimicrobia bacterium RIFCSPLOWO2_12_FULL_59_9]